MNIRGHISLFIEGKKKNVRNYYNREGQRMIVENWRELVKEKSEEEGKELNWHIEILPIDNPEYAIGDLPTVSDVTPQFDWDFKPYKPPTFKEEEWHRPPPTYSNKGHQSILDTYL